ncbi:MAG: hypothetical protein IPK03_10110 [Bacteroidetes bacterium]|nr:hypothetical protein [Bacteroidota bacterium]
MKGILTLITIFSFLNHHAQVVPNAEYEMAQSIPNELFDKFKNYHTFLIGEIHGTQEGPMCALGLINVLSNNKEKVLVALQIPNSEQAQIEKYLKTGDFAIIERMPFFNVEKPDGRNSKAMGDLIRGIYGKKNVRVVCFDIDPTNKAELNDRENLMAKNIAKASSQFKDAKIVCLTSQMHSFLYKYQTNDAEYIETMGYLLKKNEKFDRSKMLSLQVLFKGGSAYNNVGGKIGVNPLTDEIGNKAVFTGRPISIFIAEKDSETSIYNGCFFIQKGNPSTPLNQ